MKCYKDHCYFRKEFRLLWRWSRDAVTLDMDVNVSEKLAALIFKENPEDGVSKFV
jgi:hypothetical protein